MAKGNSKPFGFGEFNLDLNNLNSKLYGAIMKKYWNWCGENWLQINNRKYLITEEWEDNEITSGKTILPMEFS